LTDTILDQELQARLLSRYGRSFVAGDLFFSDEDPGSEAYLLQEGRIRLIKRVGKVERVLRELRPGDLFGESALVAGATRNATAVATTDGSVLVIDQQTLEQILSTHPTVGMRVMQQLVRRLRDAEDQIEVLMLADGRSKVVVSLLKLAEQELTADASGAQGCAELTISPCDLAARAELDLETVKRTVQQLKGSGHLHIDSDRVEIPNVALLKELSNLLKLRDQIVGIPRVTMNRGLRNNGDRTS
jgi:CRP/FNR family transcriptional regulator, cyclic AMP receptor protein